MDERALRRQNDARQAACAGCVYLWPSRVRVRSARDGNWVDRRYWGCKWGFAAPDLPCRHRVEREARHDQA